MTLVALGDEEALAELYRRVAAPVFGLVSKVVRNPAQAEEVAQEVFVELWRTASRVRPGPGHGQGLDHDLRPPPGGRPGPRGRARGQARRPGRPARPGPSL